MFPTVWKAPVEPQSDSAVRYPWEKVSAYWVLPRPARRDRSGHETARGMRRASGDARDPPRDSETRAGLSGSLERVLPSSCSLRSCRRGSRDDVRGRVAVGTARARLPPRALSGGEGDRRGQQPVPGSGHRSHARAELRLAAARGAPRQPADHPAADRRRRSRSACWVWRASEPPCGSSASATGGSTARRRSGRR